MLATLPWLWRNGMRVDLKVPYKDNREARRLGARWDAGRKVWYVENRENLVPFLKWMPPHLRKAHKPRQPDLRLEDVPMGWKAPEWCR